MRKQREEATRPILVKARAVPLHYSRPSPSALKRDITALLEQGILVKKAAGGRSTSYRLPQAHR